jgi:8-oxo-dGTP pyrophosphatase MutT (NUDIX family)
MPIDRPAPGEELNLDGEPTVPRQAATVILLRRGDPADGAPLEVLLVKRNPEARFMPGAWVFPGGAVNESEGRDDIAHRACALRELEEEAGVRLAGPEELVPFSRWITPEEVKVRFDTHFYVAAAPPRCSPEPDGEETVDAGWFGPRDALESSERGDMILVFPTIKHLEALVGFDGPEAVMQAAGEREVGPVQPRVVRDGQGARVVLPGEPGYDG